MPERKIEHVLFDPKNPTHKKHLRQLFDFEDLEFAKDHALNDWAFSEKLQKIPFEKYLFQELERTKKEIAAHITDNIGGHIDNKETFMVLQYFNGEPVGHVQYEIKSDSNPYVEFLFVKPEMRDTLSDPKPVLHDGQFNGRITLNKQKREKPLLLAKKLIDFITEREGKKPHAHGNTERGISFVEKYLLD